MDYPFEDSREDKLIEDYLISGYRPGQKTTYDLDQQFAKPIEDEDLFGFGAQNGTAADDDMKTDLEDSDRNGGQFDFSKDAFGSIRSEILCDKNTNSPGSIFEDDELVILAEEGIAKADNPPSDIDAIFLDDYSCSSADPAQTNGTNNENTCPDKSYSRSKPQTQPQALSPAQIKLKQMKESLLEQARALSNGPKKIGTGFGEEGMIEVNIEVNQLQSDSNTKLLFNKLFNRSKKAGSPEKNKQSRVALQNSLMKRICAEKRKVWDSFQKPTDCYDEEEELVEEIQEKDPETKDNDQMDERPDEEADEPTIHNSDNEEDNFEDLEREDQATSDVEENTPDNDVELDDDLHEDESDNPDEDDFEPNSDTQHSESQPDRLALTDDDGDEDNSSPAQNDESESDENSSDDESVQDDANDDFSLNLDDDDDSQWASKRDERKRRAIFIDDEASEED